MRTFDRTARWRRAARGLAKWWLVALVTVFIPVAHFVLVPGFGLFGLYVFFRRFRESVVPTSVTGICPDCQTEQQFEVDGQWVLPKTLTCRNCHRGLTAEPQ